MAVEPGIGNNVQDALPLFAAALHGLNTRNGLSIRPKPRNNYAGTRIAFDLDHPLCAGNYPNIAGMLNQLEFQLYASNHRSMRYPFWSLDGFDDLRSRARTCNNRALDIVCQALQARKMRAEIKSAENDIESLRMLARWFHTSVSHAIDEYVTDPNLKQACLVTPQALVNTLSALVPIVADKLLQIRKEVLRGDVCISISSASPECENKQEVVERLPWMNNKMRLRITCNRLVLEGRRDFDQSNAPRYGYEYVEDEIPEPWRLPFPKMDTLTSDAVLVYVTELFQLWTERGLAVFPDQYSGPLRRAPKPVQEYYKRYIH
jgi:hypothetical protein